MRSKLTGVLKSRPWRLSLLALGWLVLISALHYRLNIYEPTRKIVQLGYMPVVTNLAAPLLDQASREGSGLRFKAMKFSSFAEMAEALRNDQIQAAFIIAPLAIVLKQQGEDIRVVAIGNRHESTMVTRKDLGIKRIEDLADKTVAVPMRYSGHNLLLLRELRKLGLEGRVKIVEMNPPDMAAAMTAKTLDAYFVGEPFAAKTLKQGESNLLFHVEEVWPGFICNLVITKKSLIDEEPETVKRLVQGIARAGAWAAANQDEAAEIAARYWNQDPELVKFVLNNPKNRVVFDRYLPRQPEMQELADLMADFGLSQSREVNSMIDDSFAGSASTTGVKGLAEIIPPGD
ncbi:MAG TPA: ABC transporter substrate-binding protein [Desulfurivibrionaceae bacterium]|nr:ABC transporter substrate-binding protein [Desulfurivibrionaceae bacterium]